MNPWRTCLLDPPWPERGGGKIKRGADKHYPLLPCADMPAVILGSGAWTPAEAAHVYMWTTNNYLPQALQLLDALGVRYVTNVCWIKDRVGLGQYFRGQHELLLFGVIGRGIDVRTPARNIGSVVDVFDTGYVRAARTRHSAKPEIFHELIESRSQGPYQEMFARTARAGWRAWGNEQLQRSDHDERQCAK